ncbi:PP2C family protein-serine/threonine phosphatase [Halanaerobacter jeridensis]|uniref:PP2C family protein-serine/threonine phosphatase n=1 Tax=Halanaerobacter jeridensis TaxID=706427 RepID=UPI00195AC2F6|nr:SpoIIE family protein phosphatase [Halanaerobacter jeridensis]
MNLFIWLRVILISSFILLSNYSYWKTIITSCLINISLLLIVPPLHLNLILLELIYYLTLISFSNYRQKTKEEIAKMKQEQQDNFTKARQIHQNSLPDSLPEKADLSVAAFYQPAAELGGDYYNVFKVNHGSMNVFFEQYFIYMFDVSGHGIDSAMLSIFINNTIEDYFKLQHNEGEEVSPKRILEYIDTQYRAEGYPDDYLVCLLVGVLDLNNYEFTYSSSGFQFPFYKLSKDGNLNELDTGGLPISSSVDKSFIELEETTIEFKKNEMMFFTTDGLLEQTVEAGMYNNKLKDELTTLDYFHPAVLVENIRHDFFNVTGSEYGDDDITYLTIARLNSELKEWTIEEKKDDLNKKQQVISSYLSDFSTIPEELISTFEYLSDLIWQKTHHLSITTLADRDYFMISLSGVQKEINWQKIITENLNLSQLQNKGIKVFPCNKHGNKLYLFTHLN